MGKRSGIRGFTLVEMAVVLAGIGLITAMGVAAGLDVVETTKRVATEKKLDTIEAALMAFRKQYNRLPCPADAALALGDSNIGVEAANKGSCTGGSPAATSLTATENVPSGAVPVRALGLPDEFLYDGWGRQFKYEVDQRATNDDAMLYSHPSDNCSFVVYVAQTTLDKQPIYVLMSYGKNGVGAHLKDGSILSGTAGTQEEYNIRPSTNALVSVRDRVTGKMGNSDYYDDVVRYKMRYQMMDESDLNGSGYKGPELAIGYTAASNQRLSYASMTCGSYAAFSGTIPASDSVDNIFTAFSPGNQNIFAYYTNGAGTHYCRLFSVIDDVIAAVSASTPVSSCPATATGGGSAGSVGLFALNDGSSPYFHLYRQSGSLSAATLLEISNPLKPVLSSKPTFISFSDFGEYLALSNGSGTKAIYVRQPNGRYKALPSAQQPDNAMSIYGNAISPNGRFYAATSVSGGSSRIYIWLNIMGSFAALTTAGDPILYTVSGVTSPDLMAFSPNSEYLAVAGGTKIAILHIDPSTTAVTLNALFTVAATPTSIAFSSDSAFLFASLSGTASNKPVVLRSVGGVFTEDDTTYVNWPGNPTDEIIRLAASKRPDKKLSCGLPWGGSIADGDAITAYSASSGSVSTCNTNESRVCSNGSLSGSYTNASCTVTSCNLPWGGTINVGDTTTAYSSREPSASTCSNYTETRSCTTGGLTGSFVNQSCAKMCALPWGGYLLSGQSVTAYQNLTSSCGTSETRTCTDGTLSGSYTYDSCSANNCALPWGGYLASGSSVTAYLYADSGAGSCSTSQTRTCTTGTLSGTYTNQYCTDLSSLSCLTPWGQTVADHAYVWNYSAQSPPVGYPCPGVGTSESYLSNSWTQANSSGASIGKMYNYGGTYYVARQSRCVNGQFESYTPTVCCGQGSSIGATPIYSYSSCTPRSY